MHDLQILLFLTPDNFIVKGRPLGAYRVKNTISLNPLSPKRDLQILLCLTPDEFTL